MKKNMFSGKKEMSYRTCKSWIYNILKHSPHIPSTVVGANLLEQYFEYYSSAGADPSIASFNKPCFLKDSDSKSELTLFDLESDILAFVQCLLYYGTFIHNYVVYLNLDMLEWETSDLDHQFSLWT